MNKKKVIRTIAFSGAALILAVLIALNFAAVYFSDAINVYLYGYGVDFSQAEQALKAGDELCQEIEGEGIVMLKNDKETLPLTGTDKLNVFGWAGTDGGFVISGSGSGSADERGTGKKKSLLQGLKDAGFEYNQELISMYENFKGEREGSSLGSSDSLFFKLYEPNSDYYTSQILNNALNFSDVAIIVISRLGGEGKDLPKVQYKSSGTDTSRTYLELSTEEEQLINTVTDVGFKKVIILLNTCNAMELSFLDNAGIDAAISVGGTGQSGTISVGKLLKGEITPSGKTSDTYAYNLEDDPTYVNSAASGVTSYTNGGKYIDYSEGIYTGYRYYETAAYENYIDYDKAVQFPFGYGLSYTEFEWEIEEVQPQAQTILGKDDTVNITVDVTNKGTVYSGKDVVEVYFTAPYTKNGIEKSYVQLCAFAKTSLLKPNQTERLTISFAVSDMASYDCYDKNNNGFKGYELDAGEYSIKLQTDSHNISKCSGAEIKYNLPGIQYPNDPVSGSEVKNLFTSSEAYGNVSIDGSDSDANIVYMSRADFAGTFPTQKTSARAKTQNIISLGDNWQTDQSDVSEKPVQGASKELSLTYTDSEGNVQINEELVLALGEDYNNEQWELLLNQLTVSELNNFVELAGYKTAKADSVGKVECIDLDGPSGLNQTNMSSVESSWTCYPVESVMSSSWNAHLSYVYGLAVGNEASVTNVSGWYAPAVNIHRSPFDGRNYEYYSEDPYLSGIMGAETVRGATANGLYCYIKHFAVNETETERSGLYTWLTEQTLREIYLKPFEIAVKKGGANAVMSSFNRLGAVWTGGNYSLLTSVLRNEWGFKGTVLTDWSSGGNYMNVDQGIRAGNDCWLSGMNYVNGHSDKTSATAISCARQAAKNILYTYCNTCYVAKTHDSSNDKYVANVGLKTAKKFFPYWIFWIIGIDLIGVGGIATIIFFNLRKPKSKQLKA